MAEKPKDFSSMMAEHSDVQLADILLHPADWVPEAVEAAKAELSNRKTTAEQIVHKREIAVETELQTQQQARSRLYRYGLKVALLCFLGCSVVAFITELSGRSPGLRSFLEEQFFTGLLAGGFGLIASIRTVRTVWRWKENPPPDSSLETLRLYGEQRQILWATFASFLGAAAGGVATVLLAVLLTFFVH